MRAGPLVLLGVGALACAVRMARRRLVAVTVVGLSMQPAYQPGDRVLVLRGIVPRRGGVVVVELPCTRRRAWAPRPPV